MKAAPRILVLGAGSAGSRHATLLRAAGASVAVSDPDAARAATVGCDVVPFDLDGIDGYDGIVVASPSSAHAEQARASLGTAARVMVEKPLATAEPDLDGLVADGVGRVMVAYNLRLHTPVERFVELVEGGRAGNISALRLWFGSWLPDWRPAVDYRQTYSARSDLGGGVLDDAIHELDLVVWLLGEQVNVIGAVVDRLGPLEIDVEDTVKAILRSTDGIVVELSLDYLSRRYRRGMEAIGDQGTIRLDWARNVLEIESGSQVEVEAADVPLSLSYQRQAKRFLDFVTTGAPPPVDAPVGAASVRLASRIRAAAR